MCLTEIYGIYNNDKDVLFCNTKKGVNRTFASSTFASYICIWTKQFETIWENNFNAISKMRKEYEETKLLLAYKRMKRHITVSQSMHFSNLFNSKTVRRQMDLLRVLL